MNALSTTFADLTETLRICSTGREPNHLFGGTRVFHTVSVEGKMYRVSDRELALLKSGMTPDDLELDLEDEEEGDEYPAHERAASAGDMAYQLAKEQF